MSLKTAFAAVLKSMRATRGLSQKNLAEVSSRTYISKLERGQCSPTLEMITALSAPLTVSPLTLVALTVAAESGQSIMSLVKRVEGELIELANAGVLSDLGAPLEAQRTVKARSIRNKPGYPGTVGSSRQVEFCFAD